MVVSSLLKPPHRNGWFDITVTSNHPFLCGVYKNEETTIETLIWNRNNFEKTRTR